MGIRRFCSSLKPFFDKLQGVPSPFIYGSTLERITQVWQTVAVG